MATASFASPVMSNGGDDIVLMELGPMLTLTAPIETRGAAGDDHGFDVAVDERGNAYFVGEFSGTVAFGGKPLTATASRSGFVVARASGLTHRWAHALGSSIESVAVDADRNVYVAAGYESDIVFAAREHLFEGPQQDMLVASYDAAGEERWGASFSSPAFDGPAAVTAGGGFVYAALGAAAGVTFDGGSVARAGILLVAFEPDGATHSVREIVGGSETVTGIAADATGNVYVVGWTESEMLDFGSGPLLTGTTPASFIASYDHGGAFRWARVGAELGEIADVTVSRRGDVYVAGTFSDRLDYGDELITSGPRAFVTSLNRHGEHRWSREYGGPGAAAATSIRVQVGQICVGGYFTDTTNLGGSDLVSAGSADVFLLLLAE